MKEQSLRRVLGPILESAGLELEAVEIVSAGRRRLVRIVVDGDGASGRGPNLDEIAEASRDMSAALDSFAETGSAPYTLEVSSRGVSRPLTRPAHWRRNIGRLVTVDFADDRAPVTGRISAANDDGSVLAAEHGDVEIVWGDVARALIQVELNRPVDVNDEDLSEEE